MKDTLIKAERISLDVPLYRPKEQKIKEGISALIGSFYGNGTKRKKKSILSDVSFELKSGQNLGILGRNGSGKTTLLRVICGVYQHTSGSLELNGEPYGLFNVQLGMNSQATGVENIYLRGLQMGLPAKEVKDLVPDVIEFADIGDSINDIFLNYSAGMKLRLAVAISTMIKPEILVLDEWIGSGDSAFKKKIRKRMRNIIDQSQGLVIASHNEGLMRNMCSHGLVLSEGKRVFWGPVDEAIKFYNDKFG